MPVERARLPDERDDLRVPALEVAEDAGLLVERQLCEGRGRAPAPEDRRGEDRGGRVEHQRDDDRGRDGFVVLDDELERAIEPLRLGEADPPQLGGQPRRDVAEHARAPQHGRDPDLVGQRQVAVDRVHHELPAVGCDGAGLGAAEVLARRFAVIARDAERDVGVEGLRGELLQLRPQPAHELLDRVAGRVGRGGRCEQPRWGGQCQPEHSGAGQERPAVQQGLGHGGLPP